MNWNILDKVEQLDAIRRRSHEVPCLIFKHSTTCVISVTAKQRMESDWDFKADEIEAYYLDLLQLRPISNAIASDFGVHHESPQILLIRNGECIYDASHLDIQVSEIREYLEGVAN